MLPKQSEEMSSFKKGEKKMKTVKLSNMIAVSIFLVCSAAIAGGGYMTKKSEKNIAEVAIENGSFTTLVAALACADLVGAVSDAKAQLTVFAPTDEAFNKAGFNKDNICDKFPDKKDLKNILLYHVAGKMLKSPAVVNGEDKRIEMLNGDAIRPEGKGSLVINANKSNASVVIPDVKASNGVIHVIDGVLLP